jgi:multicomponent Na+:H+ antiporter subunit C
MWGHWPYVVAIWLFVVGLYGAATSRNLIHLCLCLVVSQSSTYVILAAIGYRAGASAPVFAGPGAGRPAVDPVVQALMLTDVVVQATVVALLLSLIVQITKRSGTPNPHLLDALKEE